MQNVKKVIYFSEIPLPRKLGLFLALDNVENT